MAIMKAKQVKKLISDAMTNRKKGVSVVLGECDDHYERIEIKYRKTNDYLSLNPIQTILHKNNFYVAQIIDFYDEFKRVILLIRKSKKVRAVSLK